MTLLQMLAVAFDAVERLLVLVGPIALAAYAIPATERFTNAWLKLMLALLAVRFAWTIIFILFPSRPCRTWLPATRQRLGTPTPCSAWLPHARFSCSWCRSE